MKALHLALFCATLLPTVVEAAGFAHSANFVVYSPKLGTREEQQRYASEVLQKAETIRRKFSEKWLGETLADGVGRSTIYITFSKIEDSGLTWAKDHPDRVFHNVYLTTTPEKAAGTTLEHEIVHTVLATRFPPPNRLPPWVEEGIATRFDDDGRKEARRQLEIFWLRNATPPRLVSVLTLESMDAFDDSSYAAASSLVSFLLTKDNEQTLLRFAVDGQRDGWSSALLSNYGIASSDQLQTEWELWINNKGGT